MKTKFIATGAMCALLALAGCSKTGSEGKYELKNQNDTLSYLFGSANAIGYWSEAHTQDSTLLSQSSRDAYLKGFEDTQKLLDTDDRAYLRGVAAAVALAGQFEQLEKQYNIKVNQKVFISALKRALESDTAVDANDVQTRLMVTMEKINREKNALDNAQGLKELAAYAQKNGYMKYNEGCYGKVIKEGNGEPVQSGYQAPIEIKYTNVATGKPMEIADITTYIAGYTFPPELAFSGAIGTMKPGEEAELLVTLFELVGNETQHFGATPATIVKLTVKLGTEITKANLAQEASKETLERAGSKKTPQPRY